MIDYYFIPIVIIVVLFLLVIGYKKEDHTFSMFGGFILMCLGVYLVVNGIEYVDPDAQMEIAYGELWNFTSAGYVINFPAASVYTNLTGLAPGFIKNMEFMETDGHQELEVQKKGVYLVDFAMSFSGGTGGLYGFSVSHNHDVNAHRNCYARRAGGSGTGSVSLTCLMDADVGDTINVQVEDEANPPRSITVYTTNMNVNRIDDLNSKPKIKIDGNLFKAFWMVMIGLGGYLFITHGLEWIKQVGEGWE